MRPRGGTNSRAERLVASIKESSSARDDGASQSRAEGRRGTFLSLRAADPSRGPGDIAARTFAAATHQPPDEALSPLFTIIIIAGEWTPLLLCSALAGRACAEGASRGAPTYAGAF